MTRFRDKPAEAQWLTPYLIVNDMREAIRFYTEVLGLDCGNTMDGPEGVPVHAEFKHKGKLVVMCAPEGAFGATSKPPTSGGFESPFSLYLYVDDVDAAYETAKAAGAAIEAELEDMFWGDRYFQLADPAGYSWGIASHIGEENAPPPPQMPDA